MSRSDYVVPESNGYHLVRQTPSTPARSLDQESIALAHPERPLAPNIDVPLSLFFLPNPRVSTHPPRLTPLHPVRRTRASL